MDTEIIKQAIIGAISSRGKNKGFLKAKCPPMNTPEAAAWQAIMSHANPYKVGFGHLMFMDDSTREIYNWIKEYVKKSTIDVRSLDKDRNILEKLGAW